MDNPKAAIDSVLEAEKTVSGQLVYPLTLGRYALLELAESPFVTKGQKFSTMNLIPTFFIMTHDMKDLVGYSSSNIGELKLKALEWADSKDVADSSALIEELMRKFNLLEKVKPEAKEDSTEKKTE